MIWLRLIRSRWQDRWRLPLRDGPERLASALLGFGLLVALPAGSEVMAWTGSLAFDRLAGAPLEATARGLATLNGSGAGLALGAMHLEGTAHGSAIAPITDPVVSAGGLVGVRLAAGPDRGSVGTFFPPASPAANQLDRAALPLLGFLRLCLFSLCQQGVTLDLAGGAATVGLGVGGLVVASPYGPSALSLLGAPWTVRTATLGATTTAGGTTWIFSTGGVHGPLSFTGSTALSGGTVRLVSPVVVESRQSGDDLLAFARLTVRFLPETRTLVPLLAAAACLWLAARRRSARGRAAQ